MKMWGGSDSTHSHSAYHASFSHDISLLYENLRKMEISRIESYFFPIYEYTVMPYDDKFISRRISEGDASDDTIGDREDGCSNGSSDIDPKMTSGIFMVIELIVAHIRCKVCISEDGCSFTWIFGIEKRQGIIERYRDKFTDCYVFESF
jgi:hypothetical protein